MSPSTINSSRPFRPGRGILAAVVIGVIIGALSQAAMAPADTADSATCTTR